MKKLLLISLILFTLAGISVAQRKILHLPDLPGYVTLKCDFYMHTVFPDGNPGSPTIFPDLRYPQETHKKRMAEGNINLQFY